jgi:hypothetical protein
MRKVTGGNGQDTTAATQAYLQGAENPLIRHLYLIGEPENPQSIWMTDHEAPVSYKPWGIFYAAVVKRGTIACKAGLEVQNTSITWTPGALQGGTAAFTQNTGTASPLQLARLHVYDNWPVRIWKVFMPTPGDANTLGACEWFGGRVGSCTVGRSGITFNVDSFLNVVTQKLPANVIESTSTLAGYTGASLVAGETGQPTFVTFAGTTTDTLIADCLSPTANKIYPGNIFVGGYAVFLAGAGATLAGIWSAIGQNGSYLDGNGNSHSSFALYTALPWAPTPGVDQFYVSPSAPINQADGDFFGFPFVPSPQTAV